MSKDLVETKEKVEEDSGLKLSSLLPEKISRRAFGKLLGAQTLLASAAASVTLSGCLAGGGGDEHGDNDHDHEPNPHKELSRAAFVATISDYFDWAHSSEYADQFKSVQKTFVDVTFGETAYAKQIETALEESLIDNSQGYFYPEQAITREDAADIYAKAFKLAVTGDALGGFSDAKSISAAKKNSVNAMVSLGFMSGTSAKKFSPKGKVTAGDAKAILEKITATTVAPVQVMPKPGTTSPRRYVSYTTPTPGAQIYITETFDGSEPEDPTTSTKAMAYDFTTIGARAYVVFDGRAGTLAVTQPGGTPRAKAVAKKDGLAVSAVQSFSWNLYRPGSQIKEPAEKQTQPFEYKLVHQATATAPAVYKIYNMSESVQAFSFLIMGPTRGIIFDFLQVHYLSGNMKPIVDMLAAGKPYDAILGHNNGDHVAQIGNFSTIGTDGSGGVAAKGGKIYTSKLEKYQLMAVTNNAGFKAAGDEAVELTDGQVFDLGGGINVTAWAAPGHSDGLMTLVTSNGWVYASDMWACNRPYTADTTNYSGVRSDLQVSLIRQLLANYKKSITNGQILEVTNAHQEVPVGMPGVNNFVKCFQKMIDQGPSATEGSIRFGINRMSMVHNDVSNVKGMWSDKNWMAVEIGANPSAHKAFTTFTEGTSNVMTSTGLAYPCNNTINYNTEDGYKKYSVLANLEITDGTLVGTDVHWNVPQSNAAGIVDRKLTNKFDPWTYAYTINVPTATNSIALTPWAMSNNVKSMTINGAAVKQGSSAHVHVSAGSTILINIVAADGVTTSSYTFTVAKV